MRSIVVFCGSSEGANSEYAEKAYQLGETFAKKEIVVVYGGAKIGIMGKVAEGALNNSGKVIGVIPEFLKLKEVFHEGLTELIVTQNMHDRKLKMHELSDGILMLPGGFGTLEEFFEMLTWSQLGLHHYPIGILNTNGFYDSLLNMMQQMVAEGFVKSDQLGKILVDTNIEALVDKMNKYQPLPTPIWIKKEQL
ncbi:TIGR00730 family Rossman fold protein [Maribacter sp. ACAM166]|uniref:LOG family protein n=1 Tax=Maribacter sp. ACAM166 TaxID=2508996 RepID=UPI001485681C|nr:TIGR00730 family Rossman fold protein [Maribacter sp. ACAM166]